VKIPASEWSWARGLALRGKAIELLPPDPPVMQRRADQDGRGARRSQGEEVFHARDPSADAHLHGGVRLAESQEQLLGSSAPAGANAGKIEQQQPADPQVENLP